MSQKGKGKQTKEVKLSHRDVPREWQQAVRVRALEQGVDEDSIIRFGLYHDFKGAKEEADSKDEEKATREETRDLQKETKDIQKEHDKTLKQISKTLDDILKELKEK